MDREIAENLKESLSSIVARTTGPEVIGGIGGFGGLFKLAEYESPILVSSTDGVGTKVLLGLWTGRYEALGVDLVNACLNDVIVTGADPLFFLDYIAAGKLDPHIIEGLVRGMTKACIQSNCSIVGGETAEMPGVYGGDEFDMAGFAVGAVEEEDLLDPEDVAVGDILVGFPSNGIHTNGFSLIRNVFDLDANPSELDGHKSELGQSLGEALSQPHRSYVREVKASREHASSFAHITGGGLVENIPRALPDGIGARLELGSWEVPTIFSLIQEAGDITPGEMHRVFNMGLGMIAICDPDEAESVLSSTDGSRTIGVTVETPYGSPAEDRVFFQ